MRLKLAPILKRIAIFFLIYTGIIFFYKFSGLGEAYGDTFRNIGKSMYEGKWGDKTVSIDKHKRKKTDPPGVNTIILIKRKNPAKKGTNIIKGSLLNTWIFACLPNLFFIALTLIIPADWLRKVKVLFIGLIILNIVLVLKLGLNIIGVISVANWFQSDFLNTFFNVLAPFLQLVEQHSIIGILIAFFIWLILCFDSWITFFYDSFNTQTEKNKTI